MALVAINNYYVKLLHKVGCFDKSPKNKGINQFLKDIKEKLDLKVTIQYHFGNLNGKKFINNCNKIANVIRNNKDNAIDVATFMKYTTITCSSSVYKDIAIQKGLDVISQAIQQRVAWAIQEGKFRDDKDVLLAIANKLEVFTYPKAQQSLAWAIQERKFGEDKDVLLAIAKKLEVFTYPVAQTMIARAILNKTFGDDKDVLLAIAKKLEVFTYPVAQRMIARAILNKTFGNDQDILNALVNKLEVFTDIFAQRKVAEAISDGQFGDDKDVLIAIADKLENFTDPEAQRYVAVAIQYGYFGKDQEVLFALANKLEVFTDPFVQQRVAYAIQEGKFGNDQEVLLAIVNKLEVFTDPEAQKYVAWAIQYGYFGKDKDILIAIANNLKIFTYREAQQIVAWAIKYGQFGKDKDVLLAIANKLKVFTDPDAQRKVAYAIRDGKFGNDKDFLLQIIKAPLTHRYIDRIMNQLITSVNGWQDKEKVQFFSEFKLSNEYLSTIKKSLPVDIFRLFGEDHSTDTICKHFDFINTSIQVNAPLGEEFNRPYDKTGCIVKKTEYVPFTNYQSLERSAQITINGEVYSVSHPFNQDSQAIKLQSLQNNNTRLTISIQDNGDPTFTMTGFVNDQTTNDVLGTPIVTKEITTQYKITSDDDASIVMKEIDANGNIKNKQDVIVQKHNNQTIDQYELVSRPAEYKVQRYRYQDTTYLISVDTTKIDPSFFDGWISNEHFILYTSLVDNVAVYELDTNNGSERMIDSQNLKTIKDTLPSWLQIAIDDVTFNLDEYQDREIIKFGTNDLMKKLEELVSENDKQLVSQMKSIIERGIVSQGDRVDIASDKSEDQKIKDDINRMCSSATESEDFSAIVRNFIEKDLKKDPIKIAKLGFLLGQLAKQGVLGYAHDDDDNQANNLFYCLSKTCFDELNKISDHDVMFPDDFITQLGKGVCIEQLTNDLMIHNLEIQNVWKKKANS